MKTKEEIFEIVSNVLAEDFECPREKLHLDTKMFEELDLDSIDAVDMVVRLQKITKKRVDPESFKKIRTIGDVVDVVYELVNNGK